MAKEAPTRLGQNSYLQSICQDLLNNLPRFRQEVATFVHGDLHHSNWVETTSGLVYLTDWETACVTDRMLDVAYILTHYILVSPGKSGFGLMATNITAQY